MQVIVLVLPTISTKSKGEIAYEKQDNQDRRIDHGLGVGSVAAGRLWQQSYGASASDRKLEKT